MKSNRPRRRRHAALDARNRSLKHFLADCLKLIIGVNIKRSGAFRFNCFPIDVLLTWFTRPQGHKVFILAPAKRARRFLLSITSSHALRKYEWKKERFFHLVDKFTIARRNLLRQSPHCEKFPSLFSFMENHKNNTIIYICSSPHRVGWMEGCAEREEFFGRAINSLPRTGCAEKSFLLSFWRNVLPSSFARSMHRSEIFSSSPTLVDEGKVLPYFLFLLIFISFFRKKRRAKKAREADGGCLSRRSLKWRWRMAFDWCC